MSLINKVLRDLDGRNAGATERPPSPAVKPVDGKTHGHEWFWRTVAGLVLIALGWVGWVVYQIQPRPIATELAQQAAERAAKRAAPTLAQAPLVVPAPPVAQPVVAKPAAEPQAPPATKPAEQPEVLRFAYSIETPIGSAAAPTEAKRKAEVKPKPEAKKKPATEKPRFERRDVALTPVEKAEVEFRRGVDLLKRGRASEADAAFRAALAADSAHRGARQAMVVLRIERGDLEGASRLLKEALAADASQPDFAVALARIHVERVGQHLLVVNEGEEGRHERSSRGNEPLTFRFP